MGAFGQGCSLHALLNAHLRFLRFAGGVFRFRDARSLWAPAGGRIAGEDLDVLRNALEDGRVVALDLTEVELADRDAVTLLARTESNGIELRHCPAYIREWVTRERDRS